MPSLYPLLGVPHNPPFDPTSRYTTSWLLPPTLLAILRLLISLYAFVATFFILGWDSSHLNSAGARYSFSFFTNLTYWGLAFYFLVSAAHTVSYARRGISWLQRWPRGPQAAHAVFYTTVATFPILVTVVFWAVLFSSFRSIFATWSNISVHALNTLFSLFEILLTRTSPPPPLHLAFIVLLLALYLALAYLTQATQGFYPYPFLDPSKGSGRVAGYIFGILVAACVIFGLVCGLIWLRRWVTEKVLGMEGKFARGDGKRGDGNVEMGLRGK